MKANVLWIAAALVATARGAEIAASKLDLVPMLRLSGHHMLAMSADGKVFAEVDVALPSITRMVNMRPPEGDMHVAVRKCSDGETISTFVVPGGSDYLLAGDFAEDNKLLYIASEAFRGVQLTLCDLEKRSIRRAATNVRYTWGDDCVMRVIKTATGLDIAAIRSYKTYMRSSVDLETLEGKEIEFDNSGNQPSDHDAAVVAHNVIRKKIPNLKTKLHGCELREFGGEYLGLWVGEVDGVYGRRLLSEASDFWISSDEDRVVLSDYSGVTLCKVGERKAPVRLSWTTPATTTVITQIRSAVPPVYGRIANSRMNALTGKALGPDEQTFDGVVRVSIADDETLRLDLVTEIVDPDTITKGWVWDMADKSLSLKGVTFPFGKVDE